jgi:hypothetical protein
MILKLGACTMQCVGGLSYRRKIFGNFSFFKREDNMKKGDGKSV